MRHLSICAALLLAGCATAEVTETCQEARDICRLARPFTEFMPISVSGPAAAICSGAVVCSSPGYAEKRERVLLWLRSR